MDRFTPTEPAGLLARSYYELLESKQPILGAWIIYIVMNTLTLGLIRDNNVVPISVCNFVSVNVFQVAAPHAL